MTSGNVVPELKQVLGAMLFGSRLPVSVDEMRRVLVEMGENPEEEGKLFAKATAADIQAALDQLKADLAERRVGVHLVEVAGGFRFQTDAECGPWLRRLLDIGKPTRLTRPTLETLAIIAYRQPVTRAEIEAVRGVTVDTIVRHLMELQLIRLAGRSPLPGRPLLYGTTQLFLEHFGLKSLKDLPGIEQLCRREEEYERRHHPAPPAEGAEQIPAEGQAEPGVATGQDQEAVTGKPAGESEPGETAAAGEDVEEKDREPMGPENAAGPQALDVEEDDEGEDDEYDEDDDEDEDEDEEDEEDEDEEDGAGVTERPALVNKKQPAETKTEPGRGEEGSHEHESGGAQKSD